MERLRQIAERCEKATEGPWGACCSERDNGCSHVMFRDYPVCEVTTGNWGDDYPSLRFVEGSGSAGSLNPQVEAYMDQITYGEVSPEQAKANKLFIAHSREDIPFLLAEVKRLQARNERLEEAVRINGMESIEGQGRRCILCHGDWDNPKESFSGRCLCVAAAAGGDGE